jgi:rubrerythrin
VIRVAGAKYYAGDLAELKESFNENDYVVCPTCKKKIPQKDVSTFCPFCNNEI